MSTTLTESVTRTELPVTATAGDVSRLLDAYRHHHLSCAGLASARQIVADALRSRHRNVMWLSGNQAVVPAGARHLDPIVALDSGVLDQFADSEELIAVVLDADALDAFDVCGRMELCAQARAAGRFVRLTRS